MIPYTSPENLDLQPVRTMTGSRRRSRSASSMDNQLLSGVSTGSIAENPLVNVCPEPVYIAASAAARLVTGDHEDFFRSLHDDGILGADTTTIFVNSGSLSLVNQFLDFLLYSFLSNANSTSLSALRPAVAEVLRFRLAKEAVTGADQELVSYLGDEDENDLQNLSDGYGDPPAGWSVEATWKKCRMQCMVYSSLGDLEEDEAFYLENDFEGAVGPEQHQRDSRISGIISPAVAIWLTSILEFIGEQTLLVAGHATIARYSTQRIAAATGALSETASSVTFPDKPMVEELDTEKVALNPSLGRMWRQWRKRIRGSRGSLTVPTRQTSLAARSPSEIDPPTMDGGQGGWAEVKDTASQLDNPVSGSLPENVLSPIAEMTSPSVVDPRTKRKSRRKSYLRHVEDRRPQSLASLPRTSLPLFIRNPALRRHRSLPDIRRGDFTDSSNEREETPEEQHLGKEVWLPGDDSAITGHLTKKFESNRENASKGRHSPRSQAVEACVTSAVPMPLIDCGGAGEASFTATSTSSRSVKTNNNDSPMIAAASQRVDQMDTFNMPDQERSGMLHVVSSMSKAASYEPHTEQNSFRVPPELLLRRTDKVSSPHSKHSRTQSSSSGHSLSDRKIGRLHLVQTSSSNYSTSSERTANGRAFTPPVSPQSTRRSSSFSLVQRPIHTSGSGSSHSSTKLKALIQRSNDGGKNPWVNESDGESRSSLHSDRLVSLDKKRSLEELISSGDTIHCTITPDPLRNEDQSTESLSQRAPKTPTSELAEFFRTTSPDSRPLTSKSSKAPAGSPRSSRLHIQKSHTGDSSTSSLSEFLRATPPNTYSHHYSSRSNIPSSAQLQRVTGSQSSAHSTVQGATAVPSSPGVGVLPSVIRQIRSNSPIAIRTRNRLLAREASGSSGSSDTTSALADFFRNTTPPVNGKQPTAHRISRSVAPFRNTMDSTQFDPADDDIIEESEPTNRELGFAVSPAAPESYQSSFTSSTALLRSNSKKQKHDYGGTAFHGIRRKQSRVKDQYDLDMEDLDDIDGEDDDEGLDLVLPKPRHEEESLADFLRNASPPPNEPPQPFIQTAGSKSVQKKTSAVSLMSRFSRSSRKNSISATNMEKAPPIPKPVIQSRHVPLKIPTENSSTLGRLSTASDQFKRPSYSEARVDFDSNIHALPSRGALRNNTQARGGRSEKSDTDSLADFLKYTGPPPQARNATPKQEVPRSLLQKISFSRNKKVAGFV